MTPEQFIEFTTVLPEPHLFLDPTGEILGINTPAALLFSRQSEDLKGKELWEFLIESKETVVEYLQGCSRSQKMVPDTLTICTPNGETVFCRVEGAAIQLHTQIVIRLEKGDKPNNDLTQIIQNIEQIKTDFYRLFYEAFNYDLRSQFLALKISPYMSEKYIESLLKFVHLYQQYYPKPPLEIQQNIEEINRRFNDRSRDKISSFVNKRMENINEFLNMIATWCHHLRQIEVSNSSSSEELITTLQQISQLLEDWQTELITLKNNQLK